MKILRAVAGFLLGYAFVVLVTEFGFRPFAQGRASLAEGPIEVAYATLVAVVAGLGGGAAGAWIGGHRAPGALIALPLMLETSWLFFFKKPPEPLTLFEAGGAVALIACTLVGAFAWPVLRKRWRAPRTA